MEKNPNRFYIYALLDTRKPGTFTYIDSNNNSYIFSEYEPFYIGFASGDYRPKAHFTKTSLERREGQFKNNVIKKIKNETGKNPLIFRVKEHLTEQQAIDLEIELIKVIGKRKENKGPLTNVQDGGNPGPGYVKTTPDTYNRLRELHLGKPLTPETIENMKKHNKSNIYKVISPDDIVHMVTNLTEFCKNNSLNYGSMVAIARSEHRPKTHKGWQVSYVEKKTSVIDRRNWYYKLISPDGVIYTTNNLTIFCKYFNLGAGHLMSVANGKALSHMGFIAEKIPKIPKENLTHYYEVFKFNYYIYLPNGKQILSDNLQKPCKENNLFIGDAEYYLKHSKINSGFVGFRLKKSEDTIENRTKKIEELRLKIKRCVKLYKYIFQYKDGNIIETYSCNVIEFCKNNNLSYKKIRNNILKYPAGIVLGDVIVTRELIYKDFLTDDFLFTNIEAT